MAKDEKKAMLWRKSLGPAPPLVIPKTDDPFRRVAERLAVLQYVTDLDARPKPERQAQKGGWQLKRIKKVLAKLFPPDGRVPSNLTDKAVQRLLVPVFKKNDWREPSIDSIARARGRRDRRD
jgi:hypothetical protein